ncbi:uncharacterized protein TNCV_3795901 [Trichonephila clavipes]|nr:uncharacterized protein TNCV_3795901 [Trichonephila clavipes]
MCSLPLHPRGLTTAQPRNTSQQNQDSNSQTSAQIPSSSSTTSSNNNTLVETTSLTQTNRRALIPVIINNDTEIQAICDSYADITVIQQSCVPNDIVTHLWTDGQLQVVDHEIKPIGWISLNIIFVFDWLQQVQARGTYDPNGSLCISTPTSFHLYECVHASKPCIYCVALHQPSQPSLDDITLSEATTNAVSSETKHITKSAGRSKIRQAQIDAVIEKFIDIFFILMMVILDYSPYLELKIELKHEKTIRIRPYRLSEPDRQFLKTQIQKWFKQGICHHSNSPYAAPAFIVEQPFYYNTPRRVVVDFSRTINPITKLDLHPIDQTDVM